MHSAAALYVAELTVDRVMSAPTGDGTNLRMTAGAGRRTRALRLRGALASFVGALRTVDAEPVMEPILRNYPYPG